MTELIEEIRKFYELHPNYAGNLMPPASIETVESAEAKIGFAIPQVLRDLYLNFSNGGFGPGVFGLDGGYIDEDRLCMEDIYVLFRVSSPPYEPDYYWPVGVVPICDLGSGIRLCIDVKQPDGPIIRSDPNLYNLSARVTWSQTFVLESPSVEEWLRSWLQSHS